MNLAELEIKTKEELLEICKELGIVGCGPLKKQDIMLKLLQTQAEQQGYIFSFGILETVDDGYGFLRQDNLLPSSNDVYVSQSQIRRFGLRTGDVVTGQVRSPKNGEKYPSLIRVEAVNGVDPESAKNRPHFSSLTPIFPDKLIDL
ncbi:MAG: Rho termination factor N-terminal domain-containing protein, partial [Dehalococcoidia bacterium]|nr:Rho termination factor N-terminal domain-containing protein [Dehalococcoidia bacterium]